MKISKQDINTKLKLLIKPDFLKVLEVLNISDRFICNVIKYSERVNQDPIKCIKEANIYDNFGSFISDTFVWEETPEGQTFWSKIHYIIPYVESRSFKETVEYVKLFLDNNK